MVLLVSNEINLSTGATVTNAIGNIIAGTDRLLSTGNVSAEIQFYLSADAMAKKLDNAIPVILKQDGTIDSRVGGLVISLTEQEALGADLPGTIYTKVAAALTSAYGWTVSVQA